MASVTSYTKDAIDDLLDDTVTGGNVNGSGELILTKKGGTSVNAGAVVGPAGAPGSTGPQGPPGPTGSILMWPTNTPPPGWIICDGTTISVVTYPELCGVLGDLYGLHSGDFYYLPNLKGRVPVGRDAAQTEFDGLGEAGGAKTHVLTQAEMPGHTHTGPSHTHTGPSHTHTINHDHAAFSTASAGTHTHFIDLDDHGTVSTHQHSGTGAAAAAPGTGGATLPGTSGVVGPSGSEHAHSIDVPAFTGSSGPDGTGATGSGGTQATGSTGSGSAHNNLQPYIVLNYIIKT